MAPDGTWLVSASHDKTLRIWDVSTGATRDVLEGHIGPVYGCAVAPDGSWIVSGGARAMRIWDVATGKRRNTMEGPIDVVMSCAVAPDGTWIVSASTDNIVRIWDVATATPRQYLGGTHRRGLAMRGGTRR